MASGGDPAQSRKKQDREEGPPAGWGNCPPRQHPGHKGKVSWDSSAGASRGPGRPGRGFPCSLSRSPGGRCELNCNLAGRSRPPGCGAGLGAAVSGSCAQVFKSQLSQVPSFPACLLQTTRLLPSRSAHTPHPQHVPSERGGGEVWVEPASSWAQRVPLRAVLPVTPQAPEGEDGADGSRCPLPPTTG